MALSVDLLEPLDALGILGRSIIVFRERWFSFLVPNVLSMGIVYLIFFFLVGDETMGGPMLTTLVLLSFFIVTFISESIVAQMVVELYADISKSLWRSTVQACSRILPLFGCCVFTVTLLFVPAVAIARLTGPGFFCLLFVCTLGLYFLSCTFHAYPCIMAERLNNPWQGLKRAFQLSSGYRGLIIGAVLLYCTVFLAVLVMCLGIEMVLDSLMPNDWLNLVVGLLVPIPLVSIGSILKTVVYLDIRSKKEGYTMDVLNQELGAQTGGVPSTSTTYSNMDKDNNVVTNASNESPKDNRQVLV